MLFSSTCRRAKQRSFVSIMVLERLNVAIDAFWNLQGICLCLMGNDFVWLHSTSIWAWPSISRFLSFQQETQGRIGKASAACRQMSRGIFANPNIAIPVRLQLLKSLVLSIVFHGSGTWPLLTHRQFTTLTHVIISWQRRIAGDGF